jgi:hypothetical protein
MFTGMKSELTGTQQLIAVVAIFVVVPIVGYVYNSATSLESFNKNIKDWTKRPSSTDSGSLYIRGKVLPIRYDSRKDGQSEVQADVYWALPSELRASSPDDVGTVVWLSWTSEQSVERKGIMVHLYGVQHICRVTVIDKKTDTMLGYRIFRGVDPRKPNREGCDADGKPIPAIIKYLTDLRRRSD